MRFDRDGIHAAKPVQRLSRSARITVTRRARPTFAPHRTAAQRNRNPGWYAGWPAAMRRAIARADIDFIHR